jgi:hypothetical protein
MSQLLGPNRWREGADAGGGCLAQALHVGLNLCRYVADLGRRDLARCERLKSAQRVGVGGQRVPAVPGVQCGQVLAHRLCL